MRVLDDLPHVLSSLWRYSMFVKYSKTNSSSQGTLSSTTSGGVTTVDATVLLQRSGVREAINTLSDKVSEQAAKEALKK